MTMSLARLLTVSLVSSTVVTGCATPGTRPQDMGITGHEAAAKTAEREASLAAGSPALPRSEPACAVAPCWSDTPRQTEDAKHLQTVAAQHRAAAQSLRSTEEQACAGFSERDRDVSPFFHRNDIIAATRLEQRQGKYGIKFVGAVIHFRAVAGLTPEWLQRSINCHLARSAALGFDRTEMEFCPLALKGVAARVSSGGDRYLIEVTAGDARVAEEIWRRAQALASAAR